MDHSTTFLVNKTISNGRQNNEHDSKKSKTFSQNKFQTQFQIPINHIMQCAMLQNLASAQHYYNLTLEQIK